MRVIFLKITQTVAKYVVYLSLDLCLVTPSFFSALMRNLYGYMLQYTFSVISVTSTPIELRGTALDHKVVRLLSFSLTLEIAFAKFNGNQYKKLSYRRETARQLHMTTWAGQLTF